MKQTPILILILKLRQSSIQVDMNTMTTIMKRVLILELRPILTSLSIMRKKKITITITTMGMRQTLLQTLPVLQSLVDVRVDSEAPLVKKEEAFLVEDLTDQASGLVAILMMTIITQVVRIEALKLEEQWSLTMSVRGMIMNMSTIMAEIPTRIQRPSLLLTIPAVKKMIILIMSMAAQVRPQGRELQ